MSYKDHSLFTKRLNRLALQKVPRTHTPIHGGSNLYLPLAFNRLFKYDFSEVEGLDDLSNPTDLIAEAQNKTAELFQVEQSFFSVNGASACILAACLALGQGGKVLLPSNAHKSVISGLILSGAEPIFYEPDWDDEWGLFRGVNSGKIADLLKSTDNLKGCFVTSPTYEGVQSDLDELVEMCHEKGVPVIADESHGAHLSLLGNGAGAINSCADLIIHSPHKTLGSLTQTGLLHVQSQLLDSAKVQSCLNLIQSTSPSYLLLSSLIETLNSLSHSLQPLIHQALVANHLRHEISKINGLRILDNDDLSRCVISLNGWDGRQLSEWLHNNYHIETELESNRWALFLVNLQMKWHQSRHLKKALDKAAQQKQESNCAEVAPQPPFLSCSQSPRKAFFESKEGRIEFKCPPGTVNCFPGSIKTQEKKPHFNSKVSHLSSRQSVANPFFEEDFDDDYNVEGSSDEGLNEEELANYA